MTNKVNAQAGEWEAYQNLPLAIRDALKSAGRDYSSVDALQMLTDIRKNGVPDYKAIPFVLDQISFLDRMGLK
jgi:hypothetical protein